MRRPKTSPLHKAAPAEWRHTPNITGDYDFDAAIMHCGNSDMPDRLSLYLVRDTAYGGLTGYNGYRNYHKDS